MRFTVFVEVDGERRTYAAIDTGKPLSRTGEEGGLVVGTEEGAHIGRYLGWPWFLAHLAAMRALVVRVDGLADAEDALLWDGPVCGAKRSHGTCGARMRRDNLDFVCDACGARRCAFCGGALEFADAPCRACAP